MQKPKRLDRITMLPSIGYNSQGSSLKLWIRKLWVLPKFSESKSKLETIGSLAGYHRLPRLPKHLVKIWVDQKILDCASIKNVFWSWILWIPLNKKEREYQAE